MTTDTLKKIKKNKLSTLSGFTLVETLVALSILLIAVVAPISRIEDSLHKMYYVRDEAVAVNLAQEGIDIVRQIRDTNMINNVSWTQNLADGTYTVDIYKFITTPASPSGYLIPCAGCDQKVYLDSSASLYRQGAGTTATQFSRNIIISSAGLQPYERMLTSTVSWKTGGTNGSIVIKEYLYDWAQ